MDPGGCRPDAGPAREPDAVDVAAVLTGRRLLAATVLERRSLEYDPYLAGRDVRFVTGSATLPNGSLIPWQAIVKTTTGRGVRDARRELAAYRLGIASSGAGTGLRAPRLLGWHDEDDRVEVWLEVLRDVDGGDWALDRFLAAARAIARADARWLRVAVPDAFDSQDAWAERHGQPERLTEALDDLEAHRRRDHADVLMAKLGDPGFARTEALIATTAHRIAELASFPTALLHHDLVRSNLFAVSARRVAAIDWEHVGRGPLGVDLAPLVAGSVRRGEASADALPDLERTVLAGYTAALRGAGVPRPLVGGVPDAYRLALGLRWHVVLGTIRAGLDPTTTRIRGSRPAEPRSESLAHLVVLARYLLAAGDGGRA
jgi:hypothetical protein